MTLPDVDSMAELIADCAEIPAGVRTAAPAVPGPRRAADWSVPETCLEQVRLLTDYVD